MSVSRGDNCLCVHTGFSAVAPLCPCQPWWDFFLRSPPTEELGAAARGRPRRGSASPAGRQSAQVHYWGRDLRRRETTGRWPRRTLALDVL